MIARRKVRRLLVSTDYLMEPQIRLRELSIAIELVALRFDLEARVYVVHRASARDVNFMHPAQLSCRK